MGIHAAARTLIAFAEKHQIPVAKDKRGEAPFSVDANLLHSSSEGKVLEDPWQEPPDYVYQRHDRARRTRRTRRPTITHRFQQGRRRRHRTARRCRPPPCSPRSTTSAASNGIGRLDLVENRFVGMKSPRRCTRRRAARSMRRAHRGIESITLDRGRGAPQGRAHADAMPS